MTRGGLEGGGGKEGSMGDQRRRGNGEKGRRGGFIGLLPVRNIMAPLRAKTHGIAHAHGKMHACTAPWLSLLNAAVLSAKS